MIKLYDYVLSVNCYKQRLMMSILDVPYESLPVDFFPGWEHKGEEFKKINPLGHIPVIDDDGFVLRDAHAILVYLAAKYDPSGLWYPTGDPELIGETASWMLFAEGTTNTASAARLCVNLGYDFDLEACRAGAHRLFRVLDEHLWFRERDGREWGLLGRAPHHRRHRPVPRRGAVGGGRDLAARLPGAAALDRPGEAHPRVHGDAGNLPRRAGPLGGRADRPRFTYKSAGVVSEAVARAARGRSEQERETQLSPRGAHHHLTLLAPHHEVLAQEAGGGHALLGHVVAAGHHVPLVDEDGIVDHRRLARLTPARGSRRR